MPKINGGRSRRGCPTPRRSRSTTSSGSPRTCCATTPPTPSTAAGRQQHPLRVRGTARPIAERTVRLEGRAIDRRSVMLTLGRRAGHQPRDPGVPRPGRRHRGRGPHLGSDTQRSPQRGADAVAVRMDAEGMVVDELARRSTGSPATAVSSSSCTRSPPSTRRPAGACPLARRRQLLELAEHYGFLVLEDNVYGELRYDGEDPDPVRARPLGAGREGRQLQQDPRPRCGSVG